MEREEIRRRLEAAGVDITPALSRVQQAIRTSRRGFVNIMLEPLHMSIDSASDHLHDVRFAGQGLDWTKLVPAAIGVLNLVGNEVPNPIVQSILHAAVVALQAASSNPSQATP